MNQTSLLKKDEKERHKKNGKRARMAGAKDGTQYNELMIIGDGRGQMQPMLGGEMWFSVSFRRHRVSETALALALALAAATLQSTGAGQALGAKTSRRVKMANFSVEKGRRSGRHVDRLWFVGFRGLRLSFQPPASLVCVVSVSVSVS